MLFQSDTTSESSTTGSSRFALTALVLANIVPLIGVLFLGWSLFLIMFIYWLENWVIGAFNLARMALAKLPDPSRSESSEPAEPSLAERLTGLPLRLPLMLVFSVHYGLFCFVHGVFVFTLFGREGGFAVGSPFDLARGVSAALASRFDLLLAVGALVVSHGVSFVTNYLWGGEWKTMAVRNQMFQPYSRVVVLHVTILFGGFAVMMLGAPVLALVFMVVLKVMIDLQAHRREHGEKDRLVTWLRRSVESRGRP